MARIRGVDFCRAGAIACAFLIAEAQGRPSGDPGFSGEVVLARLDPAILDVAGTWDSSGKVVVSYVTEAQTGVPSKDVTGEGAVVLLDASGNVLNSRRVRLPPCTWILEGEPGLEAGLDESNVCPFGVSLEYPQESVALQFRAGDRVLLEIDPVSWTLRTAINAIPDQAYASRLERRKALISTVDVVESLLSEKKYRAAREKLADDIRDKVVTWIGGIL